MLCIAKTVLVWAIVAVIGTNLLGLVLRPVLQWRHVELPSFITDPAMRRRDRFGRIAIIIIGSILTAAYYMALYHFWGVGVVAVAACLMVIRLPDLLYETQFPPLIGRRIMLSRHTRPRGGVYSIVGLLGWAAFPVLYLLICYRR